MFHGKPIPMEFLNLYIFLFYGYVLLNVFQGHLYIQHNNGQAIDYAKHILQTFLSDEFGKNKMGKLSLPHFGDSAGIRTFFISFWKSITFQTLKSTGLDLVSSDNQTIASQM